MTLILAAGMFVAIVLIAVSTFFGLLTLVAGRPEDSSEGWNDVPLGIFLFLTPLVGAIVILMKTLSIALAG